MLSDFMRSLEQTKMAKQADLIERQRILFDEMDVEHLRAITHMLQSIVTGGSGNTMSAPENVAMGTHYLFGMMSTVLASRERAVPEIYNLDEEDDDA